MITTRRISYRLTRTAKQTDCTIGDDSQVCTTRRCITVKANTRSSGPVDYLAAELPTSFQEVWSEYKQLGSHALQATLKRVDFQAFSERFGRIPKFKASRQYSGGLILAEQAGKRLQMAATVT